MKEEMEAQGGLCTEACGRKRRGQRGEDLPQKAARAKARLQSRQRRSVLVDQEA